VTRVTLAGMAERSEGIVRASDHDREQTLAALREHTAAGRLSLDEFSERAAVVYSARTLGELAGTTADLPVHRSAADPRQLVVAFLVAIVVVALLGLAYWVFT
jgi:Domain of unknown function (DUF1707)